MLVAIVIKVAGVRGIVTQSSNFSSRVVVVTIIKVTVSPGTANLVREVAPGAQAGGKVKQL